MLLNRNAMRGAALTLALPPLLAACTATPSQGPSASPTPTPIPTATSTTPSPAEQDLVNARQAVVELWATVDRLTNDPQASLQDLDTVASGDALEFFRKNLTGYRLVKLTGSGSSIVGLQSAQASGNNSQGLPTWTVNACVDTSNTRLLDTTGKNVTAPPYRFQHRSVVVERSGALRVDQDEVLGTC